MAHLSLGFFHLSSPPCPKPPPPPPTPLHRSPSSLSCASPSAPNAAHLPSLPFHLFSPGAHQWFFSAAPPSSIAGGVAALSVGEESIAGRGSRLIAQNIPWSYTCEDVKKVFERHGAVLDVELSMHNSTRNRGLAFITMGSEEEAEVALHNLNLYELDGRIIKVEYARSVKKKPSTPPIPVAKHNVFVGNLTYRVRSRDLRDLFSAFNPNVLSAEVIFQTNPRRSAGYGFASFASKEEAEAAIAALTGKKLMGRAIRLAFGKKEVINSELQLNEDDS